MTGEMQDVKFYQTGTFTVGNRLLGETERSVQANMQRTNSLNSGHRACQGCGEALGARYAIDAAMRAAGQPAHRRQRDRLPRSVLDALPRDARGRFRGSIRCSATPRRSRRASPPRCACTGRTAIRVVAQGGDGGTTDIGFGCLSGMFERNDDVLYICYDNEAYMNTGVQRSSATPPTARTATTPAVGQASPATCSAPARTCR